MPLKKTSFKPGEIPIYDDAVIYQRGPYWQMRMWLTSEGKYARFSLKTRNQTTAIDKAQNWYHELIAQQRQGKNYFSKTAKQGVDEYLKQRYKDVEGKLIVPGRYSTIKTHLQHWLDYIGRDTKLKELARTDCENYFGSRTKTSKKSPVSQTTIANEQSTINAMMLWLFKRNETAIDAFDFKRLPRIDRGDEALRRATFTDEEIADIKTTLEQYIEDAQASIAELGNVKKLIHGYYMLLSIVTGLRPGEQKQLRWSDIEFLHEPVAGEDEEDGFSLVKIIVRAEITKVRKTRKFIVADLEYFDNLHKFLYDRFKKANEGNKQAQKFGQTLVFSADGESKLTSRSIGYHFDQILKLADIENLQSRNLVPYSFRHYFITNMINEGANPTQVAETCGTSTVQIERTYYHTSKEKMITNALPNFEYRNNMLYPKRPVHKVS